VFEGALKVMKDFAYMPSQNRNSTSMDKSVSSTVSKKDWLSKKPTKDSSSNLLLLFKVILEETYEYFVTKQGCTINTNWSVELLALFCAKFQSDDLINVSPKYHFLKM